MATTPRRRAAPPRAPGSASRAKENRPIEDPESQEAVEAQQAASLFAELLCGTPRAVTPSSPSGGFGAAATESAAKKQRSAKEDEERMEVADADDAEDDDDAWEIACVMARRRLKPAVEGGPPGEWQYLVRWVGKPPEEDRWVPESALDADFLRDELEDAAMERTLQSARISAPENDNEQR